MNSAANGRGQLFCSSCAQWKPETDFAWLSKNLGVRQYRCRPCFRTYYQERKLAGLIVTRKKLDPHPGRF
jgi:hypothetical protein